MQDFVHQPYLFSFCDLGGKVGEPSEGMELLCGFVGFRVEGRRGGVGGYLEGRGT